MTAVAIRRWLALACSISPTLAKPQPPTRAVVEEFRIDGAEHLFTRILGVMPTRGGNVIVMRAGDPAATIFSSAGTVVRSVGRKGEGPGEVQALGGFGLIGDTLWLADRRLNRITLFGPDGHLIRTISRTGTVDWSKLRPDANGGFAGTVFPDVLMPGDIALGKPTTNMSHLGNGVIRRIPLVRMSWAGTNARIVAEMPVERHTMGVNVQGDRGHVAYPFRATPFLETSRDGRHIVLVDARETPLSSIRIVHFNEAGDTIRKAEIPYVPLAIPATVIDSVVKTYVQSFQNAVSESAMRDAIRAPKSYYPVDRVLVDAGGHVWMRGPAKGSEHPWTIVSAAGKVTETLLIPAAVEVRWIDGAIWGVTRDADDVPSVVRLRRK